MSADAKPNIDTVSDPKYGYNLIRMAFAIIGGLAVSYLTLSGLAAFYDFTLDPAAQTIVTSAITGFFGFIAGRKS